MFENLQIDIDKLPAVDSIEFIPVDRRYFQIIIFNLMLTFLLIAGAFLFLNIVSNWIVFNNYYIWFAYGFLVIVFIVLFSTYKLGFKKRKYALREHDLMYTSGLITNSLLVLPFNRIQHIEVKRSFFARQLNLTSLKIYSAGNSGGDLSINGLPKEKAAKINALLTSIINERL